MFARCVSGPGSNVLAIGYFCGIILLAGGCAVLIKEATSRAISARAIEFAERKPAKSRVEVGLSRQARIDRHVGKWHRPVHVVWSKPALSAAQLAVALDAAEDLPIVAPVKPSKIALAAKCTQRRCTKSRRAASRGSAKALAPTTADGISQSRKPDPFVQFQPYYAGSTAEITERGLRVRG